MIGGLIMIVKLDNILNRVGDDMTGSKSVVVVVADDMRTEIVVIADDMRMRS